MKDKMKKFGAWLMAAALALAGAGAVQAETVAKTEDGTTYTSLADALAAVRKDNALAEVSEEAWPVSTPIYYNGNFHATMSDAIAAANTVNSDTSALIYVRPNFSFGGKGFTHDLLKTSITIYGNNASIGTSWEPSLELPGTPESAANGWHRLTKNVTHAIYNLHDGAGVWGGRCTAYTVTVTMENCNNAHECWCQYDEGAGLNHFIVRNCTFTGDRKSANPVTSNNGGSILVEDCAFSGVNSAITANVKQSGNQTVDVVVKNCTFENVGESASKGGLRLQTSQPSTINLTAEGLTFSGENKSEVTLGDAKALAEGCAINYTITKSTGKLNAFDEPAVTMVETETYGNVVVAPAVAKIGTAEYETLAAAIAAANAGDMVEIVKADTYSFPSLPKNITLSCCEGVIFNCVGSGSISSVPNGCTVIGGTFNMGQSNYHGWQHAGAMAFENSTFNGKFFGYANLTFTGCHFVQTEKDYCMWTYSSPRIDYINCTFDCLGKAVNVYWEQHEGPTEVTADGCTFNSTVENKPALKINSQYGAFVVATTANNTLSGFPRGISGYDNEPNEGDNAYIVTNAEFDEAGKLIGGDANREFPESIVGQYFATDLATVSNTEGEIWKIGVKTEDNTIITTKPQESKVEVLIEVVQDAEVVEKIEQSTKVEGVKLSATADEGKTSGIVAVVEEAKKNTEFAAAVETAAEVSVKVEVEVKPTAYDNTADKGKVAFKLTPKATVTVGEGDGKLEQVVPVTNDMIDQNQKIAVSIYTGFAPATILHNDDNGVLIETFGASDIVYDEATGVATVEISHFSSLLASQEEIDVERELLPADIRETAVKVADGFYQNAATYTASTDFYITSKAGLEYLRDFVNRVRTDYSDGSSFDYSNKAFGGKTVHLLTDIDLNNEPWVSIGWNADKPFCGSFNGENHTISNMKIVNETITANKGFYAGLFGYLATGNTTFQGLTFNNVTVKNVSNYAGALCGRYTQVSGAIKNIKVTGTVDISATSFVGGIAGHNAAQTSDCSVDAIGQVKSTAGGWCGGIAGYVAENSATVIEKCSVKGGVSLTGTNIAVGGITGHVGGKNVIKDCTVDVTVTGGAEGCTGAIAGKMESTPAAEIINNDSTKVVDGNGAVIEKQLGGAYAGAATCIVGTGVTYDENGKISGGSFESLPGTIELAEGFVPAVDPETGKTVVEADPITGSGTEADPYVISDLKGLKAFRDRVNAGNTYQGKFVKLGDDIDLASVENWEPIGTSVNKFKGSFDGDNHTISNLKINAMTGYQGLFGFVTAISTEGPYPTLKNLTLENVDVSSYYGAYVGGFAGQVYCCTLENIAVSGSVYGYDQYVGGIAGHSYGTFTNCRFEGNVEGWHSVAGIAGSSGSTKFYDCFVDGEIKGWGWVGGIAGNGQEKTSCYDCVVKGKIVATKNYGGGTGGIAGMAGHGGNNNNEFIGNYFDGVVLVGGQEFGNPIIGAVNSNNDGAAAVKVEDNSWNTEKIAADVTVVVVGADGVSGYPTEEEVRAAAQRTEDRNANLVGSVKDLEYVGSGAVEIAAGSAAAEMTPEQIKAKVVESDPTKTVKIVDGKVVVTENVAKVGETLFPTLDAALQAATDGTTLTLLKDVADIGARSLNGITFDGNGHKITGASALYCGAGKTTTIRNVVFENIHNSDNTQSAIYAEGFKTGAITITGCTFDTCDWDAIQIVPAGSGVTGSVAITNNVFRHSDDTLPQLRYIHIQYTDWGSPKLVVTATDNQMYDCEKGIDAFCVAGYKKGEGSVYSGNYISNETKIECSNAQDIKIVDFYPMRSQPTVDTDDLDPKAVFNLQPITTAEELVSAINACTTAKPDLYFRGDLTATTPVVLDNANITKIWWYGVATSGTPGFTFTAPSMTTSVPLYLLNNAKIVLDGAFVANAKCEIISGVYSAESFSGDFAISGGTFNKDVSAFVNPHVSRIVDNGDNTWTISKYANIDEAIADGKPFLAGASYYYASLQEAIDCEAGTTFGVYGNVNEDVDCGLRSSLVQISLNRSAAWTGALKAQTTIKLLPGDTSYNTTPSTINFTSVTCPTLKLGNGNKQLRDVTISGGEIDRLEIDSTYVSTTLSGDLKVDAIVIGTYYYTSKSQKAALTITGGTYGNIRFRTSVADGSEETSLPNEAVDLKITGGTFGFDPTAYVDTDNYEVVENATEPKTWKVQEKAVCQIGDVTYPSLEAAAEAAAQIATVEERVTIQLLSDIDFSQKYEKDAGQVIDLDNVTLDLDGYEISANNFGVVYQGDNMTIKNGTFTGANNASYAIFVGDERTTTGVVLDALTCTGGINVYKAKVTIKSTCATGVSGTNYYAVWADEAADITIEDGSFATPNEGGNPALSASKNATGLIVKGGIYSTDPTTYVANGYEVVANTDYQTSASHPFKVQKKTEEEIEVPVDDSGEAVIPVKVPEGVFEQAGEQKIVDKDDKPLPVPTTKEQKQQFLVTEQPNGLKVWQNVAMGVDGNTAANALATTSREPTAEEKAAAGKMIDIVINTPIAEFDPPAATGVTVSYKLLRSTDGGVIWTVVAENLEKPEFPVCTKDDELISAGDTFWKFQAVFESQAN